MVFCLIFCFLSDYKVRMGFSLNKTDGFIKYEQYFIEFFLSFDYKWFFYCLGGLFISNIQKRKSLFELQQAFLGL